jgi:hypothetical protein
MNVKIPMVVGREAATPRPATPAAICRRGWPDRRCLRHRRLTADDRQGKPTAAKAGTRTVFQLAPAEKLQTTGNYVKLYRSNKAEKPS